MKRRSFLASLAALVAAPLTVRTSDGKQLTLTDDGVYGKGPGFAALEDEKLVASARTYHFDNNDPTGCPDPNLVWIPKQRAYQFTEYSINKEGQLCYFSMLFDEDDIEDWGNTLYMCLPAVSGRKRPQDFIFDRAEVRGLC